ncbi:hypothetical protein [Thermococcus sp.]|uniref:hypothetical protein n=1 Tax=Thermococcus sp. TaxID=35749 RepID=UPI002618A952|nr:hypothetical protein [Thermococcus sp.]
MGLKLFKSDMEKAEDEWRKAYEKGINQRKWEEAAKHFKKAYEHYSKAGNPKAEEALLLAYLFHSVATRDMSSLKKAAKIAAKLPPNTNFNIPFEITASEIANEGDIIVAELPIAIKLSRVNQLIEEGDEGKMEKFAAQLEKISQKLLMNSSKKPVLGEFFNMREPFEKRGYRYLAYSKLLRAKIQALYDPSKSVELYSEAMGYFKIGNLATSAEGVAEEINKVGTVAKCWFCGRTIQGEDVHYIKMPAVVTPYILSKYGDEKPESLGEDYVVACRACYTAIYITSDTVARRYYEMAMERLQEVRQELLYEIKKIWDEIERIWRAMPRG